jgi:acetyltransferase-like isoleucine patch superfamily enzyme
MGLKNLFRKIKTALSEDETISSGGVAFTKDHLKSPNFSIGEHTYGVPKILFNNDDTQLIIGKFCSISSGVQIFLGGNHRSDWVSTYPFNAIGGEFEDYSHIQGHPATNGNVEIGNDVWIAQDVTILSGVKIGNGAIIGAASLIAKEVGAYEIWGGNPAKLIRKRFDEETIEKLEKTQWWNWSLEKIKTEIPNLMCAPNDQIDQWIKQIQ